MDYMKAPYDMKGSYMKHLAILVRVPMKLIQLSIIMVSFLLLKRKYVREKNAKDQKKIHHNFKLWVTEQ